MAKGTWVGQYYVDANGVKTSQTKTVGWKTTNGQKYYFDANGNMTTGFTTISGNRYFFNNSGVMLTGLRRSQVSNITSIRKEIWRFLRR